MKTTLFTFICCSLFFFTTCKKDNDNVLTSKKGVVQVSLLDEDTFTCETANLSLLDGQLAQSYDGSFESYYLYGNIWDFSEFGEIEPGEIITIKYQLLEDDFHPTTYFPCTGIRSVQIEILKIKTKK